MENLETLIENFAFLESWEDKYQYLIELGEQLEPLPDNLKTDAFKVAGCQSEVWLVPSMQDKKFCFRADSDAIMVKGIISILLAVYHQKNITEIKNIEVEKIFDKLGLEEHLSPSRRNGMRSMVDKIRFYAAQFEKTME
ncbi:MAG: SufE family protein [Alphaproteobacteria bacterium]|nr:SufE family protein [Alphaproteobacteria bacterium]